MLVSAPTGPSPLPPTTPLSSERIPGAGVAKPLGTRSLNGDTVKLSRDGRTTAGAVPKLSEQEEFQVQELKARDREVRAHEQAHLSAAGHLPTSGPTFEYETGPDGQRYAVAGEVQVSIPEGQTPEETLRNAEAGQRAASAPKEPSAQDRAVASRAAAMAQKARAEINRQRADVDAPRQAQGADNDSALPAIPKGAHPDPTRVTDAYRALEAQPVMAVLSLLG